MDTIEQVLLVILTSLMSLFFVLLIAVTIVGLKLVSAARRAVQKAEQAIDNVESATAVIKDVKGPLAVFKLVKNILEIVNKVKK